MKPGTLVVVHERDPRVGAEPVMHTTIGIVEQIVDLHGAEPMVVLKPLKHFCYVLGYHELGRYLPTSLAAASLSECRPLFVFEAV